MRAAGSARVKEVLEMAGPVEWAGVGLGSDSHRPGMPRIIWRYKEEPAWFADRVGLPISMSELVGECEWTLEKPGRNWVAWPTQAKVEFEAGDWRVDSKYFSWVARNRPDFCSAATNDLPLLLDLIARRISAALGDHTDEPQP